MKGNGGACYWSSGEGIMVVNTCLVSLWSISGQKEYDMNSVPKGPQQNGVAERCNQTLVEMTRAILSGSGLPQSLWAETLSTAAYLRNHSPTKAVKGMMPFEHSMGRNLMLQIFMCLVVLRTLISPRMSARS